VTDAEAEHIRFAIENIASVEPTRCPTDRDSRRPSWAGSSSTVEPSIFASASAEGAAE
jgi:hypothetical protein